MTKNKDLFIGKQIECLKIPYIKKNLFFMDTNNLLYDGLGACGKALFIIRVE